MKSGQEVSEGDLRAEGPQQTAAAGMIATIWSLPHSGATSLYGLAWAPPLEAQAGQRKLGIYIPLGGPRGPVSPCVRGAVQPQTSAWLGPREKPASQHDSHIPSGWNAFIWPRPSLVGRAWLTLHIPLQNPEWENKSSSILKVLRLGKVFIWLLSRLLSMRSCSAS